MTTAWATVHYGPIRKAMADLDAIVKDSRIDVRRLSLTLGTAAVILVTVAVGLVSMGVWLERTNTRGEVSEATAAELQQTNRQLSEIKGSLETLMSMQTMLAQTAAEVGALDGRMDSFEIRLQTMDAWIQTTRERLQEQGFRTPPYKPQHPEGE